MHIFRGDIIESVHYGAIAVVDQNGQLLAYYGDPQIVTYLRSSAKPFQAIPFIEAGGHKHFGLDQAEIAALCASHSGTDEHLMVIENLQKKCGFTESHLQCGVHPPLHQPTADYLKINKLSPTPNRHNCSGKHTGMLAYASMLNTSLKDYLATDHAVQTRILQTIIEVCELRSEQVGVGIDGCSAPNFAMPLSNAAWGYAKLINPVGLAGERAAACTTITEAMRAYPRIVAGPDRFDTRLMEVTEGKIVAKGGAEGYQGIGILKNSSRNETSSIGIAIKVSDGDRRNKVRAAVSLEVLSQLGILSQDDLTALSDFGPRFPIHNWRNKSVGHALPIFQLVWM